MSFLHGGPGPHPTPGTWAFSLARRTGDPTSDSTLSWSVASGRKPLVRSLRNGTAEAYASLASVFVRHFWRVFPSLRLSTSYAGYT